MCLSQNVPFIEYFLRKRGIVYHFATVSYKTFALYCVVVFYIYFKASNARSYSTTKSSLYSEQVLAVLLYSFKTFVYYSANLILRFEKNTRIVFY